MKKIISTSVLLLFAFTLTAQIPQAIKYQTVVRGSTGEILPNQYIGLQFSIHDGSSSGTIVYQEKHYITTNQFGLGNLEIGTETPIIGTFPSIDWEVGLKFLEVELDPTGSSGFTSMGTTQLVSVPYALYAETSSQDGDWTISGNDLYTSLPGNVGIGTTTPSAKMDIKSSGDGYTLLNGQASTGTSYFSFYEQGSNDITFHMAPDGAGTSILLNPNGESFINSGRLGIGSLAPQAVLDVRNSGTEDIFNLYDGASEVLTVVDGGWIGIGTPSPTARMDIKSSGDGYTLLNGQASTGTSYFSFYEQGSNDITFHMAPGGAGTSILLNPNGESFINSGNLGIGTISPSTKLHVDGTITANNYIGNGSGLTGIAGDNLGNHVATQNLSLGDYNLTGNPTDGLVVIDANGELWFSPFPAK